MSTATAERVPRQDTPPPGASGVLTGTGTLIRLLLRRDRIKLPAWLLGITALVFYYGAVLPTVFETDEQLQGLAGFLGSPVGALISGPGYGADQVTLERAIVGVYGLYVLLLAALMNMLLVSRHTRVEEQLGRAELVRANVVGRHAQLTATLVVAVVANAVLALLVGGAMAGNGYGFGDGLLFGASTGAFGLVFAGVTALTVQVTEYSRAATGIAGAALGAAFVIRAAGDMIGQHGSLLSWFSPMAWSQQTRAYVDGRWWPLLLSLGLTALVVAAGYVLAGRRDLGAGLVAARRGAPVAARWLRSPIAFAFRLQRSSLIGWGIALALAGVLFGWITDEMIEFYQDMGDDMIAVLGGSREQIVDGYLSVMALVMVLLVGVFVILGVQSLRAEETRGRAEPVLATATSRWTWAGGYLAVLALGAVGLLALTGFATGVGAAVGLGEASYVWDLTWAHLVHAPAVLVLLAIATLLFGVFPRGIGLTWVVLGYAAFLGFFGPLMDPPQWLFNLSPMEHIARLPLAELTWAPVWILTAIVVVLGGAGLVALRRRDLETK